MLSEEERAKIRAEEVYRDEIRNEIARANVETRRRRIWTIVNSSFFLWFASTIFVGGITYAWTSYQNQAADARIKQQREIDAIVARTIQIKKLNFEIEGRLSQFLVDVERMVEKSPKGIVYQEPYLLKRPFSEADIRAKWQIMKGPPRNLPTASLMYPEFSDRGIVNLIVELRDLELQANSVTAPPAYPSASALTEVIKAIQTHDIAGDDYRKEVGFLPIWLWFRDNLIRDEWNKVFPYTDCTGNFPFC